MKRAQKQYVRQMPKIYGNLQRKPRSFAGLFRVIKIMFGVGALGAVAYLFWFGSYFKVKNVEIVGNHFTAASDLRAAAPVGQNIWFFNKEQVATQVLRYPVVESVGIYRGIPNSLRIVVQEKQPSLVWFSGDTATVLDQDGVAFAQYGRAGLPLPGTPVGDVLVAVPKVYDVKAVPVTMGKQVASANFITFVRSMHTQWMSLVPSSPLDHVEIADTTYDVTFVGTTGLRVLTDSLGDPGAQARNLARLLEQKKAGPTSAVDLRIDRWAYVTN